MSAVKEHKKTFRESQFEAREIAIVNATNELLASKGYDAMVMDDIANSVGIAKGSLYKHFASKEALAAAVMIQLIRKTRRALKEMPETMSAWDRIRAILEWTLRERLDGGVPHLPQSSQVLREFLTSDSEYVDELMELSDSLGELIEQAKLDGAMRANLNDSFVLYYVYARSCDPTLDYLKDGGAMSDDEIVDELVCTTMNGLAA